jgi:hypothetical protein
MRTNRPRENAIRVSERYRRLRAQPDLTIEEINEDVVPLEQLWERSLCGCDRHFLEDCGVCL